MLGQLLLLLVLCRCSTAATTTTTADKFIVLLTRLCMCPVPWLRC
jgi:hypothetical protein